MPVFRFNKAFTIARDLKAFLNLHAGVTRGVVPNVDRYKKQVKKLRMAPQKNRQVIKEQRKKIKEQREKIKEQTKALNDARRRISENKTRSAQKTQEIFRLKNRLHAAYERVESEPKTGALPDLIIARAQKGAMPSRDIPRLIVRPTAGLGNRMRVITSFQILARYLGRGFELCWAPSAGWSDEDLGDLFENDYPRVPLDEFESYSDDGLDLHNGGRIVGPFSERTWEWREGSGMHQVFDLAAFPVVTYSGWHRCDWLLDPATRARLFPNFETDYLATLKEWNPVPSIRDEVERLSARFGPHTVGVHIRRGDAWGYPSASLASQFRRSPDVAFLARMDAELEAEPHTNFFLATDSAATEERFRERYGEALIVNRDKRFVPSVPMRPKDNQRDAVIDMFALARTRKILGNNKSSFSRMAAGIGGIRLEIVLED